MLNNCQEITALFNRGGNSIVVKHIAGFSLGS